MYSITIQTQYIHCTFDIVRTRSGPAILVNLMVNKRPSFQNVAEVVARMMDTAMVLQMMDRAHERLRLVHWEHSQNLSLVDHPLLEQPNFQPRPMPMHSTQHTAHSTQHTAHCTLHTAHSTLHTAHCAKQRKNRTDPMDIIQTSRYMDAARGPRCLRG
jgi:succinate dehydrogenase/fumarate reductase flavoprotein subunit